MKLMVSDSWQRARNMWFPHRNQTGRDKPPPAMLNYCHHPDRASIQIPDYASWGNEGSLLAAEDGRPLRRIDDQLRHLRVRRKATCLCILHDWLPNTCRARKVT